MRRQVSAAYRGIRSESNETRPILEEYVRRKNLSEIGCRFDSSELSEFQKDMFQIIADEIQVQERLALERSKSGGRKGG